MLQKEELGSYLFTFTLRERKFSHKKAALSNYYGLTENDYTSQVQAPGCGAVIKTKGLPLKRPFLIWPRNLFSFDLISTLGKEIAGDLKMASLTAWLVDLQTNKQTNSKERTVIVYCVNEILRQLRNISLQVLFSGDYQKRRSVTLKKELQGRYRLRNIMIIQTVKLHNFIVIIDA